MSELLECFCCLCDVCFNSKNNCDCLCYSLYVDNVRDHKNRRLRCLAVTMSFIFSFVALILSIIELATFET